MRIFSILAPTTAQQLATIRANQTQIIMPDLAKILANQGVIMSVLTDLQAADAQIQSTAAAAVALIQSLHTGPAGSVTDAQVEAVVADLTKVAGSLSAATPLP